MLNKLRVKAIIVLTIGIWAAIASAAPFDRGCEGLLSASIDISRPSHGFAFATADDMAGHGLSEIAPKNRQPFGNWAVTAKKFGFGSEVRGLAVTSVRVFRDGVFLGYMGLTANKRAVLISELIDSSAARSGQLHSYYLELQKRLIDAKVMKAGLGWFTASDRLFLVREIQPGQSIFGFNQQLPTFSLPLVFTQSDLNTLEKNQIAPAVIPSLSLVHMQKIEEILKLDIGRMGEYQIAFVPTKLMNIFEGKPIDSSGLNTTNEAVRQYVGILNWVFGPSGEVAVDGLRYFTNQSRDAIGQGKATWFKQRGAEILGVQIGKYGGALPEYATWARQYFGLHLSSVSANSYLRILMKDHPEALAKLHFLNANLAYIGNPSLTAQRRNFLVGELFGGTQKLLDFTASRAFEDESVPYPRPPALAFASRAKLKNHARHAVEFGLNSADDYLKYANERILSSPTVDRIYLRRSNGDVFVYDEEEQWIAIFNSDGTLKTFFKPDPRYKDFSIDESYHGNPYYWFLEVFKQFNE